LLMHVLAELCHLQGDYTLVFETHWHIIPHKNNTYFVAVIAATKCNRVASCNKSPPTQNTTHNKRIRSAVDQEQDQISVHSDVTYNGMQNMEF
jgi:diadenosine tetraphosphate (Ap4A) HIT family hydrolase